MTPRQRDLARPRDAGLFEDLFIFEMANGLRAPEVVFSGRRPASEVPSLIQSARAVVLPSLAYETFGRPVVEAFAGGRRRRYRRGRGADR